MDWKELLKRRSIRFFEQKPVPEDALREMLEAARVAPSGGNAQRLRYVVIRSAERAKAIFDLTAYGAHVRPHRSPVWGKNAPPAFIAVTAPADNADQTVAADAGAAIQSMMFAAVENGLGTCWLGAFSREKVSAELALKDRHVLYLLAVGYPAEEPFCEDIGMGDNAKYYLDADDVLHVPKFTLDVLTTWC